MREARNIFSASRLRFEPLLATPQAEFYRSITKPGSRLVRPASIVEQGSSIGRRCTPLPKCCTATWLRPERNRAVSMACSVN